MATSIDFDDDPAPKSGDVALTEGRVVLSVIRQGKPHAVEIIVLDDGPKGVQVLQRPGDLGAVAAMQFQGMKDGGSFAPIGVGLVGDREITLKIDVSPATVRPRRIKYRAEMGRRSSG